MRPITRLVWHTTATPFNQKVTRADIDAWHRAKGWNGIGYHWIVGLDADIIAGRPERLIGSHVYGWNTNSIGAVYVGGYGKDGKTADTRTEAMKQAMKSLTLSTLRAYPDITDICGHRDLSPDVNHDGVIDRFEWLKECPCFDVEAQLKEWGLERYWNPGSRGLNLKAQNP